MNWALLAVGGSLLLDWESSELLLVTPLAFSNLALGLQGGTLLIGGGFGVDVPCIWLLHWSFASAGLVCCCCSLTAWMASCILLCTMAISGRDEYKVLAVRLPDSGDDGLDVTLLLDLLFASYLYPELYISLWEGVQVLECDDSLLASLLLDSLPTWSVASPEFENISLWDGVWVSQWAMHGVLELLLSWAWNWPNGLFGRVSSDWWLSLGLTTGPFGRVWSCSPGRDGLDTGHQLSCKPSLLPGLDSTFSVEPMSLQYKSHRQYIHYIWWLAWE